jgi:uncharacterized protein
MVRASESWPWSLPSLRGGRPLCVSGTTVAMLMIVLFTAPLQAAGEESMCGSVILPAAASWVRSVRPALAVGIVASGLSFAVIHGSTGPWLFGCLDDGRAGALSGL